ncbi:secreted RxLR effector protein 161-like [Nicotiana tomentosiformis]|uniref:secreted RxLR effector protein 161-like n=1 Tax=Nicotiana tomentosiformis TaxID=4098 RepID=UPI00388CBB54
MQSPRDPHLKAVFHVLRYLKRDPNLGIFLSNSEDYRVRAFCDSDWATCPQSRKSVSGYIVLLGASPISWKSNKESTIALSSNEAEYMSTRKVVGELVWLARLLMSSLYLCLSPYQSSMIAKLPYTLLKT